MKGKNLFAPVDFTLGRTRKLIFLFTLSIALTTLLKNAFSLINSLVLKYTVGGIAVTAINVTGTISSLIFNFAYGCSSGFAVLIGNAFGKKDESQMRTYYVHSIALSLLIGGLITLIGLCSYRELLRVLNVDAIYLDQASSYYRIILASFVLMMFSNLGSNLLNALGSSFAALMISLVSTLSNVAFAFLFTGVFRLDTAGVGVATLLSNLISAALAFVYLHRRFPCLRLQKGAVKADKKAVGNLMKVGLPLGFQWSVLFIGTFVQNSVVNAFGKEAQAAQGVYTQMENYLSIPLSSTATTLLNFTAQNYGKRDEKRIKEGIREATRINVGFYLVILIVCQIIAPHIAYFFLPAQDVGADVVYYSSTYLRVIAFFLIFQGLLQLARSVLQGIQKPLIPFFSGIGELVARIIVAFLLPALVDPSDIHSRKAYFAVCFSTPCAWVISFLIMGISVFVLIYRKGISSPAEKPENEIEPR